MRRMFDKDEIADIAGGGGIGELKSIDFPYGQETVTYGTTDGITLDSTARLTHGNSNDTTDVPTTLSVPLIAGNGITMAADSTNSKVNIKVDDSKVPYYPNGVANAKVLIRSGDNWSVIPYANYVVGNSIVARTKEGRIRAAEPTENYDCATKSYVDTAIAGVGSSADIWIADQDHDTKNYTFSTTKAQVYTFAGQSERVYSDPSITISYNSTVTSTTTKIIDLTSSTENKVSARGTICTNQHGIYYDVWDGTGWKTGLVANGEGTLTFTFKATGLLGLPPQAYVMVHTAE